MAPFFRFRGHSFSRRFRLLRRFHAKLELRTDVVMQFDLHLVIARIFDWPFKQNFVPVNLDSNLILEPVTDVLRGD